MSDMHKATLGLRLLFLPRELLTRAACTIGQSISGAVIAIAYRGGKQIEAE